LAYDWDNVGHQIGDPSACVRRVAVGLEVTDRFIDFALRHDCQALVTHHPLLFRPTKALRASDPTQRRVLNLARHQLGLIVAHTNLDRVLGGTNGILARRLGLESLSILESTPLVEQYKVVVFVPSEYTQKLITAFRRAGAGRIGAYSHCTFRTPGTGTFLGDAGTNPFFGESGKLEESREDRLECLVPASCLANVMAELKAAHPYEEMAADVIAVRDWSMPHGLGVVGEFPGPRRSLDQIGQGLRQVTGAAFVQVAGASPAKEIRRVAIITGSPGTSVMAARSAKVDLLITGEMGYHLAIEASDFGMTILLCGHAASERIFAREFSQQLAANAGHFDLEFVASDDFPEPFSLLGSGSP
jgi:dinuclear metal center YbgI/SA1388 family protein